MPDHERHCSLDGIIIQNLRFVNRKIEKIIKICRKNLYKLHIYDLKEKRTAQTDKHSFKAAEKIVFL